MKRRGPRFAPSPKQVREAYADAVDPAKVVQPVTRLSQMSPEKIAELEALYGAKVVPRAVPLTRPPPEKRTIGEREYTDFHPKCPNQNCDHYMVLRQGKYGAFYGCKGYPRCKTLWSVYEDGRPRGEPKIQ